MRSMSIWRVQGDMTMTDSRIHPETGKRLTRGMREQAVA
jgi:hypothetical protein